MRNVNENKEKNRLIRAIICITFALISLLSITNLASAEDAGSFDASFNGTEYATLSEAIAEANTAGGGEITLLRDVNLEECLTVSSNVTITGAYTVYRADTYTAGLFLVSEDCTLTFDGGVIIDGGNEWTYDYDAYISGIETGDALPTTSVFATSEENGSVATAAMFTVYGNVILNNATVQNNYGGTTNTTCPFYLYGGSNLTFNDGALAKHNYINGSSSLFYCEYSDVTITINDGAEITECNSAGQGGISYFSYGYIEMNGGKIHHNYNAYGDGSVFKLLKGGRFTMNDGYIQDNYCYARDRQWGGAISVHYSTHTVDDVVINCSTFTMNGGVIGPNYGNTQTTLVGNGYNKPCFYLNGGSIINVDGYNGDPGCYCYYSTDSGVMDDGVISGGTVQVRLSLVNKGTINSNVSIYNKSNARFFGEGGVINGDLSIDTITSETTVLITDTTLNGRLILNDIAILTVQNGTYNGNVVVPAGASLTIENGTFNGELEIEDGSTVTISGGLFKFNPNPYMVEGTAAVYDSETGLYTVVSGNVAAFDGVEYATLAEAISAANTAGGGTVTLLRSTYESANVDITSDITLTGEHIIFRSKAAVNMYTGTLFTVAEGATLTFDGGIVIDGGNEWTIDYDLVNASMLANGSDIPTTTYVTAESDAPIAEDYAIKVNGSVVINEATLRNHYAGNSAAGIFYIAEGGRLTMNAGAVVTHNASVAYSAVVACSTDSDWIINDGVEISYNSAYGSGGVAVINGRLTMNGGNVHHNTSITGAGCFIMVNNGSDVEGSGVAIMNGGTVHNNTNIVQGNKYSGVIYVYNYSTFTMNGGLIENNYSNRTSTILVHNSSSNLVLNAGTIIHPINTITAASSTYSQGPVFIGSNMNISGGIFRVTGNTGLEINNTLDCDLQMQHYEGELCVKGTVTGVFWIYGTSNTTVTGGTFLGEIKVSSGNTLSITGGSFKENPCEWVAEDFGAIYDPATEMFSVIETAKASVNGVEYNTIAEAVAAANDGDTVLVIASQRIKEGVVIDKNVTIDSGYQVITAADDVTSAFTVLASVTFSGSGVINTDNGVTDVFAVGDAATSGALTIAGGAYVGESSVVTIVNGSLDICGGEFAVNPDVAEGEAPDCSKLISADTADAEILVSGGSFHGFNPAEVTTSEGFDNYVDPSFDSVEKTGDVFSVIPHSFTNYVSNMDSTCEHDGTMTAKCDNCDLTHTVTEKGTGGHIFSVYVSDRNAVCNDKGTKTAKCDRCDATDTVEGDEFGDHKYENCKCVYCSGTQTVRIIIIAAIVVAAVALLFFMRFDFILRPF